MSYSKFGFPPLSYLGYGALQELAPLSLRLARSKKVLLVADPVVQQLGMAERVTASLEGVGFQVDVYTDLEPEPSLATGERLVRFVRSSGAGLIIGLGGGSALDLAKLAAVLSSHEGEVKDYLNLSAIRSIQHPGLPKILMPTTSGTGSEVTNIAVLSLGHTKDAVVHDYLLPDAAVVEPELTLSVPAKITAATGLDALTHAIEAYLSRYANPVSDALALQAIRLGSRSLIQAVRDGRNRQARSDLSAASHLAGIAFSQAGVGGVHALAYPLGGQFHVAHGEANAVLLPYVMAYIRPACESRLADIWNAMTDENLRTAEEQREHKAAACIRLLHQLVRDAGIATNLGGLGIPANALDSLAQDALKQTRLLDRSPMPLKLGDIRNIYAAAFQGR